MCSYLLFERGVDTPKLRVVGYVYDASLMVDMLRKIFDNPTDFDYLVIEPYQELNIF